LLKRVFDEQYKVIENQKVQLRPKEEIASGSVQSPHDPDSAYRHKGNQRVKGYSVNITETTSDSKSLNLITSVEVEPANTADKDFVQPAIKATTEITGQKVQTVYLDGAFQSPENDKFCQGIDMVFTGIQSNPSRYDHDMTSAGLLVTDTQTGECFLAEKTKKLKNSKEDRWVIKTPDGRVYFSQQAIRASMLRKQITNRPVQETRKRNNVEATIFHVAFPLKNGKSKYRGLFKQRVWAFCRCLYVNLVRIIKFTKQTCQRTIKTMEIRLKIADSDQKLSLQINSQPNLIPSFSTAIFLSLINSFSLLITIPF
jgi:hypothetical protein